MTDIVEKLREGSCDPNTGCLPKTCGCAAMDEAADCIEELREQLDHANYILKETQQGWDLFSKENERLNKSLKWEQHWLSRIGTHSPGCWAWGPEHYQCAVRHIEELTDAR